MAGPQFTGPRAEVVIPNWNRADLLREVLESLRDQTVPVAVCVVDNGSTDGSADIVERDFPGTRVIRLDRNLGFGRAINIAVADGTSELVVFLNNDVQADPVFVEKLIEVHDQTGAEMVAGCLRRPDGSVDSFGIELDQTMAAYDAGWGERYGDPRHRQVEPLAPSGGAALFTREAFETVGGFDERIFAYFEDVDIGIRMRIHGYRCAVAYGATALHRGSDTLGSGSPQKNRVIAASRGYMLWKWGANLPLAARLRGALTDVVVYGGQAVIDRNAGALRGRLEAMRRCRNLTRPVRDAGFDRVPIPPIGFREGLRRRRARRSQRLDPAES